MGLCESNLSVCNDTDDVCTSSTSNVDPKEFPKQDPMKFNHLYFAPGQTHNRRIGRNMRIYGCVFNLKMIYPNSKWIGFKIDQARAVYGKGEFGIYGDTDLFDVDYETKDKTLYVNVKYKKDHKNHAENVIKDTTNNLEIGGNISKGNDVDLDETIKEYVKIEKLDERNTNNKEDEELLMTEKLEVAVELYKNAKQLELLDETDAAVVQYMNAANAAAAAAVINANDTVFDIIVNIIEALLRCEDYKCVKTVINVVKEQFPGKLDTLQEFESYTLFPEYSDMVMYETEQNEETTEL